MQKLVWLCGFGVLGACATAPVDEGDAPAEPATSVVTANSFAYRPMGFARIDAAGGVVNAFDSLSASPTPVSVTHSPGAYAVTFANLAAPSPLTDATGGNVQVTAEGTNNTRCRIINWGGTPNLTVNVQCNLTDGTLADSPFAVLFYRNTMPAPSGGRASAAYSWVTAAGAISPFWDYNDSGVHNTVTKTTGFYHLTLSNALPINASMMVTPYGGSAPGAACSITSWAPGGTNIVVNIECRNNVNQLVDSAFSFSYASTGPTFEQQGAHAWFDGTGASPTYSAALGKLISCSPASVTGSPGAVVTMTVSGDLGSWDSSPFLRASFSSKYGSAGYCKVESLTVSGAPPSTTAETKIHCYDATGASVASPRLTFTHVTSDAAGPC